MRSIADIVNEKILTLDQLQEALQLAMQLEFSTIPTYLCAHWSIKDGHETKVPGWIRSIVMQEMFHMGLAGNMLSAIGGKPCLARKEFLPEYPTQLLPGGVEQTLPVDLKPLSYEQLKVFMQIEFPQHGPVDIPIDFTERSLTDNRFATIGDFYDAIADGFKEVFKEGSSATFDPNANQIDFDSFMPAPSGFVKDLQEALAAISRIKDEGEGAPGTPEQPPADIDELAHYYVFKQIIDGREIIKVNGKWVSSTSHPVAMPAVWEFTRSAPTDQTEGFNNTLKQMLMDLEACWAAGADFFAAIDDMTTLKAQGVELIKHGICPPFTWPQS